MGSFTGRREGSGGQEGREKGSTEQLLGKGGREREMKREAESQREREMGTVCQENIGDTQCQVPKRWGYMSLDTNNL